MQIMVFALILIALVAFIIYKVNNKFETKEIIILLSLILISIATTIFLLKEEKKRVPEIFKNKYELEKKVTILKLSSERLNNKNLSSKENFIYKFDYIIKKDGKEFVCTADKIKIKKIEDEYIFENLHNFQEKCTQK